MSSMAKNKGARGEYEAIALLQPVVNKVYGEFGIDPPRLLRNLEQVINRFGRYDICGVDWLAIEVKRQETLSVNSWWEQAKNSANSTQEPVLIYRQNSRKWRVVMFGYIPAGERKVRCPVEINLPPFLIWFETRLREELKNAN